MLNILYALSFSGLGVPILGFIVGPFSLYYFYKLIVWHSNLKVSSRHLLPYLLVLGCFILSNIGRHGLGSYLPSLLVYAIASSIVLIDPSRMYSSLFKKLEKITIKSFKLIFIFCILEFVTSVISRDIWNSFTELIFQNGGANSYFGFFRVRAGTTEPAVLGRLLIFYLVMFLFFLPRIYGRRYTKYIFATFILVNLTMSTTAILGFLLMFVLSVISSLRQTFSKIHLLKMNKDVFQFQYFLFFGLMSVALWFGGPFLAKLIERIWGIFFTFTTLNLSGSVGFRVGSLLVINEYLSAGSHLNILLGEGFSNFGQWLTQKYGHLERSGLSQGQPGNLLTGLILSSGIAGTISFLTLLYRVFIYKIDIYSLVGVAYALLFILSSGNLGSLMMWFLFFLIGLVNSYIANVGGSKRSW